MTNLEAPKALYTALGGNDASVTGADTIVEVLNGISAIYEGAEDALVNADAIANLAAVVSPPAVKQTKTITPTTSKQTVEPDEGKLFSKVTVNAVTAAIDDNIVEGNIKSGVTILGVTGTYSGD